MTSPPPERPLAAECSLGPLSGDRPVPPAKPVVPLPPETPDSARTGRSPQLLALTESAIAGVHETVVSDFLAVAPTDADDHNTVRAPLRPIACWGTVDARFAFDSSFIQPEMRGDLAQLRIVVEKHPDALLSVFGHADPVGDPGYNKLLSGRRATAIYAAITRKVELWNQLATSPMGRDKWDPVAFETMKNALVEAGKPAPAGRPALMRAYMDLLCTDPDGKVLEVAPTRFLGKGADPRGKADFQGCGEFNPLRVLSIPEELEFKGADRHPERNARNAPSRRVLVFLFPADTRIKVAKWPCPRASEGISGCKLRLWSDAPIRVAPGPRTREHPGDLTFSCRFYDRLAGRSPCEQIRESVAIRLYDEKGRELPGAVYRLSLGGVILQEATADAQGAFSAVVPSRSSLALIEWGPSVPKGRPKVFKFRDDIALGANPDDPADALGLLINLGYSGGSPLEVKVKGFQSDYGPSFGLRPTGILDPQTFAAIREVYTSDTANIREKATGRNRGN